jgi:hypothetical protein
MYLCPKCGSKTNVSGSSRFKDGGFPRPRKCKNPQCANYKKEFMTFEFDRTTVDKIITRRFNEQFGAALAKLRLLISEHRKQ